MMQYENLKMYVGEKIGSFLLRVDEVATATKGFGDQINDAVIEKVLDHFLLY